ncbi:MAG: exodeoxyribonuclease VII large subunit [Thermomonas sp.]|uniref:exodeoxyribonuclease VII large subunit n=1 Tax=Thermomonas sp. TaxID=1971895 RepID=UPI001D2A899A|nr:exodeoxyribonuclease VII large subunit [Thermomonas sp.]MBZ0087457.1 exodeoxyribonuclease VII large subunit [Thermomonas sp.]
MPAAAASLTPSQLNTLARELLEGSFPAVLVEGEIGNLARPASGHLYFTLKDARAAVRCALFKPKSQWLKFVPREGMQVLVRGRLTLYEPRGDYQLLLDTMEEAGEGALRRAFEELKQRLDAEGLFDPARKRALPTFPRRIGVLTSPSGAVIRDILSVLRRRFPLLEVELLPVPVQGTAAAAQIRALLARADASGRYDVLVLARGGGSLEDLWAFNDEALARAVAACATPVISAIGHETDFSLTDFAADLRAPTPSAAAELLAPDAIELHARLEHLQRRLLAQHESGLRERAQRADRAFLRLHAQRPQARLEAQRQRLVHAQLRLAGTLAQRLQQGSGTLRTLAAQLRAGHPRRRAEQLRGQFQALAARLRANHPRQQVERQRERLSALAGRPRALLIQSLQNDVLHLGGLARSLHAISPLATVDRGYSILQREDGSIIRSVAGVAIGERASARVGDGDLQLQVTGILPKRGTGNAS